MAASVMAPYSSSFRVPPQLPDELRWSHSTPENPEFGRRSGPGKARKHQKKPKHVAKADVHEPTTALEADRATHANCDQNDAGGSSEDSAIVIDDVEEPAGLASDSEFETISQIMGRWSGDSDVAPTDPAEQRLVAPQDTDDSAATRRLDVSTVEKGDAAVDDDVNGTTEAVGEPLTEEAVAGCVPMPEPHAQEAHDGAGEMSVDVCSDTDRPDQPRATSTASITKRKRSSSGQPDSPSSPSASQQSPPSPLHEPSHKRPRLSSHWTSRQHSNTIGDTGDGSISKVPAPAADPASGKGESPRASLAASHEDAAIVDTAESSGSSDGVSASHYHAAAAQEHDCDGRQHRSHDARSEMASSPAASAESATFSSRQSASRTAQEEHSQPGNAVGGVRNAGGDEGPCWGEDVHVERVSRASSASAGLGGSQAPVASAGNTTTAARRTAKGSRLASSATPSAPRSVQPLMTQPQFDTGSAAEATIGSEPASGTESRVVNGPEELEESATRASLSSAEFSLQRIHSSTSFLSTVVQADNSSRALSYQRAVVLIREELGDAVRVEHLARKQLPDGAVHLTAYVCDAGLVSTPSTTAMALPTRGFSAVPAQSESVKTMSVPKERSTIPKKDLRPATRRRGVRQTNYFDSDGSSDSDDDWPVRTVQNSCHDDGSSDDDDEDENESNTQDDGPATGKRPRWTLEEEGRLRDCVKAGMPWPDIAKELRRPESGVKQHWRLITPKSK